GRRAGGHVAGVLLVAGRVGEDELAARRREVAVGYVDRDALFALRLQAVGEQREVDRAGIAVLRGLLDGGDLILVHRSRVVQQPPDQRALPVVDAARRADPQEARHQKYPSRFFNSIEPSWSWSMTRSWRSEWRVASGSSMIFGTVSASDRTAPVHGEQPSERMRHLTSVGR